MKGNWNNILLLSGFSSDQHSYAENDAARKKQNKNHTIFKYKMLRKNITDISI